MPTFAEITTLVRSAISTLTLICILGGLMGTIAQRSFGQATDGDRDEPGPSGYVLAKTIKIPGEEKAGDYIEFDPQARRLFIARGTHVSVLDVDSDKIIGDIPGTMGIDGIALAPDLRRGFTSDRRSSRVTIFDLKTFRVLGSAPTAGKPETIVYDPTSKRVFTLNAGSNTANAIEGLTGKLAGTVELGGRPEAAVADDMGHVYINLADKNEELQIDSRLLKILHRWPLAPCESPRGLGIDGVHRRLFIGCSNKIMMVMDADAGKIIANPIIGAGAESDRFDAGTRYAFSSNGRSGTLTVIKEDSPNRFRVLENLPTNRGAGFMAIDPITHEVFVADEVEATRDAKAGQPLNREVSSTLRILVFVQMSMSS